MKTLLFIRHGESQNNIQPHLIGGRGSHVKLTEAGVEQAKEVGKYMAAESIQPHLVYTSPAIRTKQTAEHALDAAGIDCEIHVHSGLQEMTHGGFDGQSKAEIYTPEVQATMNRIGKRAKLPDPDAESMVDVGERMVKAAHDILAELEDGGTAVIFSHGIAIKCLASHILGWSREQTASTRTPNTSLTKIQRTEGGELVVEYVGLAPHLQAA